MAFLGRPVAKKTTWEGDCSSYVRQGTAPREYPREQGEQSKIQNPKFAHLALILGLALVVLNVGYGFEGSLKPLGKFPFVSRALTVDDPRGINQRVNRFEGSWLGKVPLPLPGNYLLGVDETKAEFERGGLPKSSR